MIPLPSALFGQRILVIGGTSGIGRGVARLAAHVGATVHVASRTPHAHDATEGPIPGGWGVHTVDVTDPTSVAHLFEAVGSVDHVFAANGAVVFGAVADTPREAARVALDTRLIGAYDIARIALPFIRSGGSLTFTSGYSVQRQLAGVALGSASMAGLEVFVRALALEFAPIRVNVVRPGPIDTPWFRAAAAGGDSTLLERVAAGIPLKRLGTSDEAASAALFAMSNTFVTGAAIPVDGGASIE